MSFQRGYVRERESIGGGSRNKNLMDGLNRHRSRAFAHMPYAGMTYLLRPADQKQIQ